MQLEGSTDGTAYVIARRTSLDRYPLEVADENGHIETLAAVLASFGNYGRCENGQAMDLLDADNVALFTDISRDIDTCSNLSRLTCPLQSKSSCSLKKNSGR